MKARYVSHFFCLFAPYLTVADIFCCFLSTFLQHLSGESLIFAADIIFQIKDICNDEEVNNNPCCIVCCHDS